MNYNQIVGFIWGVADLIRDTFRRGKYQDVILPFTVLRRVDCVLAPTKSAVLKKEAALSAKGLVKRDLQLRKASGFAFYNTSLYDFENLIGDAPNIKVNLLNYIAGFSPNMREVLERFEFRNTIDRLDESGLLFKVMERFRQVDLHPDVVDNAMMGTVFEELIRKFNEALNENPGEHFTPRDVVHLMVRLLLAGDEERLGKPGAIVTICDPCCGTGGMLTISKDHIETVAPGADVYIFGQESQPETFAVCKSDLFMKSETGRDAEGIVFGSTLDHDGHDGRRFDYLIANPPYGKDWKADEEAVRAERDRGAVGRFPAGLPRISDGQLLFLEHMVSRMAPVEEGGGRVAIIMNGSPLFTGDAGSGESEIRRWILENDWLETIVALPEQLFYNTGIATYVWIVSNRKAPEHKGKVQLIDATKHWEPMRRSLGDKRREIPPTKADEIIALHESLDDVANVKLFDTTHFGYRKITIERPLRLNFQASGGRIARLEGQKAFANLAKSKKKGAPGATEEEAGRKLQADIKKMLVGMPDTLFKSRHAFLTTLEEAVTAEGLKLAAPVKKAIVNALSERDETADVCRSADGDLEPDSELRDYEIVPLGESVHEYFDREVAPYVQEAWINESITDPKDGEIGRVGYEINFNRYFYVYEPSRPLMEIRSELKKLESKTLELLAEVTKWD
jgi:type I restriction enzyme M protein